MHLNPLVIILTGLIPTILGFVWYNPKVMGTIWATESGVDMTAKPKMNMILMLGVSILLSIMLASSMLFVTIHQMGLTSMLADEADMNIPTSELSQTVNMLMTKYGTNFRTFKHGALHGFITSVFMLLPVIATNALYEQKSGKYIAVNWAFWALCFALMGGTICAFA
jgi:hypothetical protein